MGLYLSVESPFIRFTRKTGQTDVLKRQPTHKPFYTQEWYPLDAKAASATGNRVFCNENYAFTFIRARCIPAILSSRISYSP